MEQNKKEIRKQPTGLGKVVHLFGKALKSKSQWTDKDEFLDGVYWLRQVIGLVLGIVWGLLTLKGMFGILTFLILNALIIYVFSISYQQINEEEYGGIWEVIKEGMMTSFSTFLVSWIVVYSALLRPQQ